MTQPFQPRPRLRPHLSLLATALWLASCTTPPAVPVDTRAPALDGFGQAELQTSSRNAEARRLFAQGMAQAYAFNAPEAVRAFKAGLAADPACTLCAWGVAWQLGPNINAVQRGDLSDARRHILLARRHAREATPLELALLDAMAVRYGNPGDPRVDGPPGAEVCGAARPGRAHPLDIAYAERLRGLADLLPDDPDVVSLYAEAELVATHDDWWSRETGRPAGRVAEVADRVDRALRSHPDHTGLNHYMVHAMDSSPNPGRAVPAADRLGRLAPASPHLVHMPSHIYVKVDRLADAVKVNQQAMDAEVALTAKLKAQSLEPVWNWDRHNGHFLWFAALMQGDADLAMANARRQADGAAKARSPYAEYRRGLPLLTLARLQRWDEVLREPEPAGEHGFAKALVQATRGLALAHTGQLDAARALAAPLHEAAATARRSVGRSGEGDDTTAEQVLITLDGWLQAELALRDGRVAEARAALTAAAAAEDEAGGEPPRLGATSHLLLGQVLLRAGLKTEAAAAFRDDLKAHPGNVWGIKGLAQALGGSAGAQASSRLARGAT